MSWIKRELSYLKDSFSQIIKALILFFLASLGLLSAIYLRLLGLNGTIISFVGIIVEIVALVLLFFSFKKHLRIKEETKEESLKKKSLK